MRLMRVGTRIISYDSLHEGGVHVFDECEDEDHLLARVFEDESRVGVAAAAQHIGRHHHRQTRDVHLRHRRVFRRSKDLRNKMRQKVI